MLGEILDRLNRALVDCISLAMTISGMKIFHLMVNMLTKEELKC